MRDVSLPEEPRHAECRCVPDPRGEAALLLAESILHGLLEKRILTIDDALAITSIAIEAKGELIEEQEESQRQGCHSLHPLRRIFTSLQVDGHDDVSGAGR